MKFDTNLSTIHGYLCGDGYVIKNPKTQVHKYYYIGFRNTNKTLLKDFQKKFTNVFRIKPIITIDKDRCKIQNKKIYYILTKDFSYYSQEWDMPTLKKDNLKHWLRAFFDCEAWVENQPAKSRLIGLECSNQKGIKEIQQSLEKLNMRSQIKKRKNRKIWRLTICGKENLRIFYKEVGFLHPEKYKKLRDAINSYKEVK